MFYEKRVGSVKQLLKELEILDSDAGARVRANYEGSDSFVFVTRFGGRYNVMIYASKGKAKQTAGRFLAAREFSDMGELRSFLRGLLGDRVEAYVY